MNGTRDHCTKRFTFCIYFSLCLGVCSPQSSGSPKSCKPFFYVSLNRFRGSGCHRLSTLLKTSPAFKRQIFGGITVTRAFRRIWHDHEAKTKNGGVQFGVKRQKRSNLQPVEAI
jgi:hypothetical protein